MAIFRLGEASREKPRWLEVNYGVVRLDQSGTAHTQELELRSGKQLINQLTEEILRLEILSGEWRLADGGWPEGEVR